MGKHMLWNVEKWPAEEKDGICISMHIELKVIKYAVFFGRATKLGHVALEKEFGACDEMADRRGGEMGFGTQTSNSMVVEHIRKGC